MARTTESKVKAVITVNDDLWSADFITHAGVITDRVSSNATSVGVTLTSGELELIETYLAAHLYALKDPQYETVKSGKSSTKQQGKWGMGLESTSWGQQALALDLSGTLAATTGSEAGVKSIGVTWLGTN